MNALMDLAEVASEVAIDDRLKSDEVCRLGDLSVQVVRIEDRNRFDLVLPGVGPRRMSAWAGLQLFQKRLGVPYEFLARRCSLGLAQGIVDQFLGEAKPDAVVVRYYRMPKDQWRVRAVLGAANPLFDNRDLLDVVLDIAARERLGVQRYHIDEGTFYCRLLCPDAVDAGGGRPDPHHFGIVLRNSEAGRYPPEALQTVVRQICTNGAIGMAEDPLLRVHPSTLHALDKTRLRSQFLERLEAALGRRDEVVGTIRAARRARVELRTLDDELRQIHRRYGLPIRNMPLVHEAAAREGVEEGSPTLFSLASILNRAAQLMPESQGLLYETAAWRLMREAVRN